MVLIIHALVGNYAKPLRVTFNGKTKLLSHECSRICFDVPCIGDYDLIIEQFENPNKGKIAKLFVVLIDILLNILFLSTFSGFDVKEYSGVHPYNLSKTYSICISDNLEFDVKYKDSTFYEKKYQFTTPEIDINSNIVSLKNSKMECFIEPIYQRRNYLTFIISFICVIGFIMMGIITCVGLIEKNAIVIVFSVLILILITTIYIISYIRIKKVCWCIVEKIYNNIDSN